MMNFHMETTNSPMTARADQFRSAMRAWTTGVAIVTAAHEGRRHGMTVSSFTSISLEPPLVAISLSKASHTHALVERAGAFGVTILAADQRDLSERFAGRLGNIEAGRMHELPTQTFVTGAPFIKGGLAFLDCRVIQTIPAGANTLFLADVVAVRGDDHDAPLVYHDRAYRRIED